MLFLCCCCCCCYSNHTNASATLAIKRLANREEMMYNAVRDRLGILFDVRTRGDHESSTIKSNAIDAESLGRLTRGYCQTLHWNRIESIQSIWNQLLI